MAQVSVLVKIMLTVLLLDPRSLDTFTLPKSVAAHATSLVIAALLVWLVARHGRAILPWSPVHVGAGALLLAFAMATPFALDPTTALFGTFKRYLGLTQMADNVLLYISVAILFRDVRSLRLLAGVGVGVAVPVLGYALIQRLGLDPLTFRQAETRIPISTLGNPDIAGAFVSIIGVTALGLAFLLRGPIGWTRAGLVLVGLACLGVLYATANRAGVLAIGGGWIAAILLSFRMPDVGRRRALSLLVIALALGVGLALSPTAARLRPDVLGSDVGVLARVDIWATSAAALLDRPVLGLGPDNFAVAYPSRRTPLSLRIGETQNSTHNAWVYTATSAGVVGLASLLLLVVLALDRALRLARAGHAAALALVPFAAYLAQALVTVNEIAIDWVFWTAAGVIAAGSATTPAASPRQREPRRATPVGAVALSVAMLIVIVGVAPRLTAGEAMLATEAYAGARRSAEAIGFGQEAVRADPRRPETWSGYGVALQGAGHNAAAVVAFKIAAERQPWHPQSWKNLAVAWAALGNADAALAAARQAAVADPFDPAAHDALASLAYDRGEYARAATEAEKAIAYAYRDPSNPATYFTAISAYVQLRDFARAEPLSRQAVSLFNTPQLRLQLAAILADQGKTADALSALDALLRDEPSNAGAQRLREAVLRR